MMPWRGGLMYDVVEGVDGYPGLVAGGGGVEARGVDEPWMEAAILMRGAGLNHWFKTRNAMEPGKSIAMALRKGPFSNREGLWRFAPVDPEVCKVE